MQLDLQSLFELLCTSCTHWLRPRNSPPPLPHLGSYTRALLVSQFGRHLFVTPCLIVFIFYVKHYLETHEMMHRIAPTLHFREKTIKNNLQNLRVK
jgi:hypothetical protein